MRKACVVVLVLGLFAVLSMASIAAADPRFHGRSGAAGFGAGRTFPGHGHLFRKDGFHGTHGFRGGTHGFHGGTRGFHGGTRGFHGVRRFHGGSSFHNHGFQGHRVFPRHFGGFGGFGGFGVVVVGPSFVDSPAFFDPSPPYYSAPVYAPPVIPPTGYTAPVSPPVMYSPPALSQPPSAPSPQVVQYPNGRYELRGDGISTPYTWVWIPNAPPPPPAPPTAPPAGSPNGAPMSGETPAARQQVYHWVDEQGIAHWTNRLESVPTRYRQSAKRLEPS
jgi:hypothetical protein